MKKRVNTYIFLVFTLFFTVFQSSCTKNFRGISEDSVLEENQGILLFTIHNNKAPFLSDVIFHIYGYDLKDKDMKEVAVYQAITRYPVARTFMFIVPAGKYRFNKVTGEGKDPRHAPTRKLNVETEAKPYWSFYVASGMINDLGTLTIRSSEKKEGRNVLKFYDAELKEIIPYRLLQIKNTVNLKKFNDKYPEIRKQVAGYVFQDIIFKEWLRKYKIKDPLKKSPQFENGYKKAKWKEKLKPVKTIYENEFKNARLEIINNYKFIDHSSKTETACYDFNNISGIKYPEGGLYKITIIRKGDFDKTLNKFKLLYGTYNKADGVYTWRMINNMLRLEEYKQGLIRITRVSMEFIRKIAEYKPSKVDKIKPAKFSVNFE